MELSDLQKKMPAVCELRYQEPMHLHTSFRIGGCAEIMAFPKNREELRNIWKQSALLDIKPRILGAGTNILAPDAGIPGLVICLKDALDGIIQIDETTLSVMAGVTMTRAAVYAANLGLSGLEFAHGIPGTVGGGIYMNAGAYGSEISAVCESVEILTAEGEFRTLSREEMEFSYRHSRMEDTGEIVVSSVFRLMKAPTDKIRGRMKELMQKRSASQPLDLPSAGSAFKRPAYGYAAALIDEAGLKGFRVGNAAVSEKHAGFVVNLGGATAKEVNAVLQHVSDTVFKRTGIRLEPEVRLW